MAGTSTQTIGRRENEDYISLLPDCLIHHIFSFLPTRDVIKTCVLSKSWQSVWTTISDLRFSVSSYHDSFVDRVLMLYVGRKVKKFHLDISSDQHFIKPSDIDSWVHFAIDHQVEDLLLNMNIWWYMLWEDHPSWKEYPLSPLLYNCSSLTKLCLRGCRFSFRESINWSSLKSLSIENVSDELLQKILMGSPVLEYLNLSRCCSVKGIHSTSLRELVTDANVMKFPLHIMTPCLLSLHVRGAHFNEAIRIIEATSLVEATLDFDGPAKSDYCLLKEMLCKLQNTTRILVGAWCLRLDIDSNNVNHESYWHIKKKFKRWAQQLKNVEIFGFYACLRFRYEEVLTMVKFLLGHASALENMVIQVKNKKSQKNLEAVDSHKLLEVAQRLQSYHRASKHAAVVLNYLEAGHREWKKKKARVTTKCLLVGHKDA